MALRIAFDLDGVLADLEGRLAQEAEHLRSSSATTAATVLEPRFPTDWHKPDVWSHVQAIENFWEQLEEIEPGGLASISTLAQARRWEIIFLTSRPESAGATTQIQTQRWLASHGFSFPSVFVVHGSRGRVAAALGLDVVVDDNPANCIDVVTDSRARSLLMWRRGTPPPASTSRYGIGAVGSIAECLQVLIAAPPGVDESRPLDRFRRVFGWRTLRGLLRPTDGR